MWLQDPDRIILRSFLEIMRKDLVILRLLLIIMRFLLVFSRSGCTNRNSVVFGSADWSADLLPHYCLANYYNLTQKGFVSFITFSAKDYHIIHCILKFFTLKAQSAMYFIWILCDMHYFVVLYVKWIIVQLRRCIWIKGICTFRFFLIVKRNVKHFVLK